MAALRKTYAATAAKLAVAKAIKAALGKTYAVRADELGLPPQPSMGDLAFPCFQLAKGAGRSPVELAAELAPKVEVGEWIERVQAQGPFVNVFLRPSTLAAAVLRDISILKDTYGHHSTGQGKRVLVEYANPNTHKEIHIGHVRNFLVGRLVVELLRATGYEVIAASYINDLGSNVARCLWALQKWHADEHPKGEAALDLLGRAYSEATRAEKDDPAAREEISAIAQALEEKRGSWNALWKTTRAWSMRSIRATFKDWQLPLDCFYAESALLQDTKRVVADLEKQGLAVEDQGALIVRLDEEKLGANLLRKSDGTLLYNAKDLALALRKQSDYAPDRSLIVVDERQSLAMQQLFATLKRMGVTIPYEHVSYGFITLPEGPMSSRTGNIVRLHHLEAALAEQAAAATRERHADWSARQVERTGKAIARAALTFAIARQDPQKGMTFNAKEALAFDGMSGPYLLYTAARMGAVLKKAGKQKVAPDFTAALRVPEARALLAALAAYPEAIRKAGASLHVSTPAMQAYAIAQAFSAYYGATQILVEGDPAGTAARVALVAATQQVLTNALAMLGIAPIDAM
jgi:arginyl-tRNA synthetase